MPLDHGQALGHVRTRSNTTQPLVSGPNLSSDVAAYNGVKFDQHSFCVSCADDHLAAAHSALNGGIEDSFSHHLRAECSDYREIMSSQVILNAAVDKHLRNRNASIDTVDTQRSRGFSISHGQVLGGFASLGLQTETGSKPPAPIRQQPTRTITKASTDSSDAPATPIEWRDSFATFGGGDGAPSYNPPPKWAHLTARPCNPLEPLDILSIEEMGLHSLDVGSLNDWEGCKLSAEILCPINGHQRIEWSVAETTSRNKKWVVVPNATLTCGQIDDFPPATQAERTVIVSSRSLWMDESDAAVSHRDRSQSSAKPFSSQRQPPLAVVGPSHRSSIPFSGKAGFELRLLRPTSGRICPPVYLANASTHRWLHQYRHTQTQGRVMQAAASDHLSVHSSPQAPATLRRSRSRPYLRDHQVPLRRSRSKPYLRPSQQLDTQAVATGTNPETFAPSLPGDPLARMHPEESWPSARSGRPDSMASMDSPASSDAGSDTGSSDEAGLSTTNTRESTLGSAISTSYDQPHSKFGEPTRSAAIPMARRGFQADPAQRTLSATSSASRGMSSNSEASGAAAGWQPGSFEQQRYQPKPASVKASSYEAESGQATSPVTASGMPINASTKQSRSRSGLQKALKKKDKMLTSWFKRKPENGATPTSMSPTTDNERPLSINGISKASRSRANSDNRRGNRARDESVSSGGEALTDPLALTEAALDSFQRSAFGTACPDATVTADSRRGSEAPTQKAFDRSASVGADKARGHALLGGTSGADHRNAVTSALSQVYGWDEQEAASRTLRPATRNSSAPSPFEDLDEDHALLGIEAVPSGALTMLIPLPLIGRNRAQDAVRYMRVNFVPFSEGSEAAAPGGSSLGPAAMPGASPSAEGEPSLSHSVSSGSNILAERVPAGQSGWKRKLGLSSSRATHANSRYDLDATAQASPPLPPTKFEPFRVTAIVHDAPWSSSMGDMDPRLPESGIFPVVLGYCNDAKGGLEMVPEGWGALRLAGVPVPTKPDGSPLDGVHPLNGVTDVIIAACTAVMDV
ncbi:hypothetical protein PSEUBRA_003372 [Kalmanozyma brasiliensis GHG001]|uniref:Uncharacterized protein n=1 Tax=Kalmanozyma brasiliensis (strain GHG001) TaxID=1365824 RepID=V5EVE2_KALBG|nr:uncharacterized protein PSEUBRA_003372 [Kalmanozyma brasiliensis GHG001]EST07203.1 hypothetical protein PSEUBRA_003372 [Kalmanozyma brasiliensis GHG001]